jgi:hypothetical protein
MSILAVQQETNQMKSFQFHSTLPSFNNTFSFHLNLTRFFLILIHDDNIRESLPNSLLYHLLNSGLPSQKIFRIRNHSFQFLHEESSFLHIKIQPHVRYLRNSLCLSLSHPTPSCPYRNRFSPDSDSVTT